MLSSKFSHILDKPLSLLAKRIEIDPNVVTITGAVVTLIASLCIPYSLMLGGLLIIFGGLFDMFDGVIARVNDRATEFGTFLDSVIDRYSDSFLLIGFAWYFLRSDSLTGAFLSIGTLAGALIISYAKARAEGLGRECNVGLMERPERVIVMALGALTGWVTVMIWALFFLTHITVAQRIWHVWKETKK